MDEDKITICLRDRTPGTAKFMLIQVDNEGWEFDEQFKDFEKQFADLDKKGELTGKLLDIYIGYWGNQGGFALTPAFIKAVGAYDIEVSVDFND